MSEGAIEGPSLALRASSAAPSLRAGGDVGRVQVATEGKLPSRNAALQALRCVLPLDVFSTPPDGNRTIAWTSISCASAMAWRTA